jgi:hypothetical protein
LSPPRPPSSSDAREPSDAPTKAPDFDPQDYPEPIFPDEDRFLPPDHASFPAPEAQTVLDGDEELWLALHRHHQLLARLERLGVTPDQFKRISDAAAKQRPTPDVLAQLRAEARKEAAHLPPSPRLPKTDGIIRTYCAVRRAEVVSFFTLAKGLVTLRPGEHLAIAEQLRTRARIDFFYAKERRVAAAARRLQPLFWLGRIVAPTEVYRLELALQRCGQLSTRHQADRLYREQAWYAYRNSRENLVSQLRDEARAVAMTGDPGLQAQEARLAGRLQASAASIKNPDTGISLAQLRRGFAVLEKERPALFRQLHRWRGREQALIDDILLATKRGTSPSEEHRAALFAGRVGHLLDREARTAPPPKDAIPPRFAQWREEILRADARLTAAGVRSPFTRHRLATATPSDVEDALRRLRQAGLLVDGPSWAVSARSIYPVLEQIRIAAAQRNPQAEKER